MKHIPGAHPLWQKGRWFLPVVASMLIFWMIALLSAADLPVVQRPVKTNFPLHGVGLSNARLRDSNVM